jgi:hypothetical protein
MDLASRSSLVTTRTSPGPHAAIACASRFLSVTVPEIFSVKMLVQLAPLSAAT